jgi:pimeloyl-ACP methyl ester carboxylesterase
MTRARLAWQKFGTGSSIVLALHGWHGGRWSFEPLLPALDLENFTWICPEYRGYGLSSPHSGQFTMAEAAADCIELLTFEGVEQCYLVGHSMGAKVAQLIALDGRIAIDGLIAITPVPASGVPFDPPTFNMFAESTQSVDGVKTVLANATAGRLGNAWLRRQAELTWSNSGHDVLLAYFKDWASDDFSDRVKGLSVRSLAIIGQHDPAISETVMKHTYLDWLPNCTLETVEGAGHYLMDEAPLRLGAIIDAFLSSSRGANIHSQRFR